MSSRGPTALLPTPTAQAFDRFVRAAPVPVIRFHDLRHTHASLLLAHRVPLVDVAYRLGDAPETILSTSAHFIPSQGQAMASAFADLVDRRRSPGGAVDDHRWLRALLAPRSKKAGPWGTGLDLLFR